MGGSRRKVSGMRYFRRYKDCCFWNIHSSLVEYYQCLPRMCVSQKTRKLAKCFTLYTSRMLRFFYPFPHDIKKKQHYYFPLPPFVAEGSSLAGITCFFIV